MLHHCYLFDTRYSNIYSIIRAFSTSIRTPSRSNEGVVCYQPVPRHLTPRTPNLRQFAIPASYQFSAENAELFESLHSLEFRWPTSTTCEKVDGLMSSTFDLHSGPLSQSSWDTPSHRLSTMLYPNQLLEKYRTQPIHSPWKSYKNSKCSFRSQRKPSIGKRSRTPMSASLNAETKESEDTLNQKVALANHERLKSLWTLSTSHGLSWDSVDHIYKAYVDQYNFYSRQFKNAEPKLRQEAGQMAHEMILKSRKKELESMEGKLPPFSLEKSSLWCPRSQLRRLAKMYVVTSAIWSRLVTHAIQKAFF